MNLHELLQFKLKNDLIKEFQNLHLNENEKQQVHSLIDFKVKNAKLQLPEKIKNKSKYSDSERCCARIWNNKRGGRCSSKKIIDDYCKIHHKRIEEYGYLRFMRYDEPRPPINEYGNKIPWYDMDMMEQINVVIQYQNMNLMNLLSK